MACDDPCKARAHKHVKVCFHPKYGAWKDKATHSPNMAWSSPSSTTGTCPNTPTASSTVLSQGGKRQHSADFCLLSQVATPGRPPSTRQAPTHIDGWDMPMKLPLNAGNNHCLDGVSIPWNDYQHEQDQRAWEWEAHRWQQQSATVSQTTQSSRPSALPQSSKGNPSAEGCGEESVEAFERSLGINRIQNEGSTLMLKNIPNRYTQMMLIDLLNSKLGFYGTYDFLYLPIDFRNRCNMGYAFVNFLDKETAYKFRSVMHRRKLPACHSNKICEIAYARVQGLEANVEHYRNSPINGVPVPAYRPKLFKNGVEYPFPPPDAPLPSIQLRAPRVPPQQDYPQ
eukprot:GEMP01019541.1.p1 GENE.GEMP01019541.1~~GEMP01019541.1.p1  ORF type:complete len:340 (+),score=60.03 GEMP01019541.1:20-1039(+)